MYGISVQEGCRTLARAMIKDRHKSKETTVSFYSLMWSVELISVHDLHVDLSGYTTATVTYDLGSEYERIN